LTAKKSARSDGNLSSKYGTALQQQTLTWNALGQLVSVVGGGPTTWQLTYDGFGRRVSKTMNGVTKRYLYDGDNLFMELDNGGAPVVEYAYWGLDNPHSMKKGGQTYYFVQDPVGGSVKGLVRQSDNSVQAQYGYTMFGYPEGTTIDNVGNTLQFAGREFDETGLYYNRARYYDPLIGRFISEDQIGLQGGINLYTYAANDPVNNRDPFGEECVEIRVRGERVAFMGQIWEEPGFTLQWCNDGPKSPRGPGPGTAEPTIGAAYQGPPPATGRTFTQRASACGSSTLAAGLSAQTDLAVAAGVLPVRAMVKAGASLLRIGGEFAVRTVASAADARYVFGTPGTITMQRLGKSGGTLAAETTAGYASMYAASTPPSASEFLKGYIPVRGTINALGQAASACWGLQ
jgi:RHS repeat-associated protein